MSTDSSTDPADVTGDVRSGGYAADHGGGRTPELAGRASGADDPRGTAGQGRRRSRRGRRRRRNPDSRSDADTGPRAEGPGAATAPAGTPSGDPKPGGHKPSNAKTGNLKGGKSGTPKPGGHKPGTPKPSAVKPSAVKPSAVKPSAVKPGPTKNGAGKNGSGKGGVRVTPPKPSDMAVMTAKITRTGLSQDTATPLAPKPPARGRRRGARMTPDRVVPERTERLRTVRETSAGGLVISDLELPVDELAAALIGRVDRRGRMMWSLPKGHIETGETAEQTAVREVAEETGIEGTVVAPLGKIDYWFVSEGRRIHKTVHHYLLRSTGGELSDADYEVSEVAWVPLHELPRRLTYSDERRLARMARGVIADLAADPQRLAQSEAESSRTEPNAYERAAAARNQRRNEPPPPVRPRRRRRRPRRPANGDG
ncbi:NUDIX domain-containing protein [Gordonia sp. NB41Y]|nr:NUDIX domain-containing protein [Gordonia sp. NB41Y]WLP88549.1 NUDIX domain-containing protein [Gordonia sp. NB41Y]